MYETHELPDTPCPACGAYALRVELRLAVLPLSVLAGGQPKLSATTRPWLVCGACGIEAKGRKDTGS
ncbi:hypothetical protein [Streptomyces sp. NPDC059122]|uniref:hypothetical protein n=1 Tax=Streptomyces sp. NPDC059122 TaxID=3346732 RepID=UPI0036D14437